MDNTEHRRGRLTVRPHSGTAEPGRRGFSTIEAEGQPVAALYAPALATGAQARLVVVLHGAGGSAEQGLNLLLPFAEEAELLLLAPKSAGPTWDVIAGGFGPDVARIDAALTSVLERYPVAPGVAVGGFSDGASYALTLGLGNGELLDSVLAFSPGFLAPDTVTGKPRLFVSHGLHDRVLPIDRCSRRLVPALQRAGYDVTYREFDGPHVVPPEVAGEAVSWLVGERVEPPQGMPQRQPGG